MLAASPADRLARLALGLGGDGAGVDDDGAVEPGRGRGAANDLGFERVQPAAEGDDLGSPSMPRLSAASSRAGSNAPSKLSAAGPVMITCPSSRQQMSRLPPSSSTAARRSASPRRCAATSAAQAPLPQARVIPAPRSQTRSRIVRRSRIVGDADIGALREQRVDARARGRAPPDRPPRHRRRKRSRADCRYWCRPAPTAAPAPDRGDRYRQPGPAGFRASRCAPAPYRRRSARPPGSRLRAARRRSRCCTRAGRRSRGCSSQATQRVALPQASASLPSGLRMRISSRAAGWRGGSSTISWSQPMPVCRSANARAARGDRPQSRRGGRRARQSRCRGRASSETAPCPWRRLYGGTGGRVQPGPPDRG